MPIEDTSHLKKGFNFLAPFYERGVHFFFGNNIFRSQIFFLGDIGTCRNALILGGGSGELLLEVVRRKIASPIYYVDISEKMIRLARERLREKAPEFEQSVHFICGSVSDIPEGIQFDLIITPYVLDCFAEKELPGVLKILTDTLNEKGIWLFVEFNVPGKGPQRAFAKTVIFLLYVFFALCCGLKQKGLANFHSFFQKLPLEATGQKTFCHGLLIACIYRRR